MSLTNFLTKHWTSAPMMAKDAAEDKEALKVQICSGDYFATLATNLDQISESLATTQSAEKDLLNKIVDNLIYIQENYKIVPKK